VSLATNLLGSRPHRVSIDILPGSFADIDGIHFSVARHPPDSISEATITLVLHAVEVTEEFVRAKEEPGINCIIGFEFFPNRRDAPATDPDFCRILQVEDRRDLAINRKAELSRIRALEQALKNRAIKKMITHREKEWCLYLPFGAENRDTILFLPIGIANWIQTNSWRDECTQREEQ